MKIVAEIQSFGLGRKTPCKWATNPTGHLGPPVDGSGLKIIYLSSTGAPKAKIGSRAKIIIFLRLAQSFDEKVNC